jgi:ribonucleoside-diphosphate reductase alpha chain
MGLLAVDLTNRISDLQPTAKKALPATQRKGVSFPKYFTQKLEPGKTPYDEIAWELRTAAIASDKGAIIFEQDDVEVPAEWSQTATNIVVSK